MGQVEILVDRGDYEIEDRNNVSRVVFQLPVKAVVKLEHMIAVHVKNVLLCLMNFSKPINIEGFLGIVIIGLDLDEGGKEVPQLLLHFT